MGRKFHCSFQDIVQEPVTKGIRLALRSRIELPDLHFVFLFLNGRFELTGDLKGTIVVEAEKFKLLAISKSPVYCIHNLIRPKFLAMLLNSGKVQNHLRDSLAQCFRSLCLYHNAYRLKFLTLAYVTGVTVA